MYFWVDSSNWRCEDSMKCSVLLFGMRGRDSSVDIATRYWLDGPGVESRWGTRFSTPVQTGPGAHPAFYTMGTGSFLGVKRPGRGADHPPPCSTEVEGRVELYICFPSEPSWPVLGWPLPLPLPLIYRMSFGHCLVVLYKERLLSLCLGSIRKTRSGNICTRLRSAGT